ncbi:very short patch repair endonuclease [Desulfovibrio sp. Fe33]|uniref:very short patch repair endonuclease n=1 Tax=Desulfovibrio sp. Fe33 TaxID=3020842 RepID=UPI00234C48C9|nr:DNA mismatch endonuclease Vsr [Desulfovibrio sp. Fe33]
MDMLKPEARSQLMAKIKSKNTKPELVVRSLLHRMGFRFRLHRRDLPGTPDIVLPKYKTVIMVNGCFWHGHANCPKAKRPSSNTDFWYKKLDDNIARDRENVLKLEELGWRVMVIWECQVKDVFKLEARLASIEGLYG